MQPFSFFRNACANFATYTSIDGFGQIQRASHNLESFFWFVMIVACVYLTTRDCAAPIRGYLDESSYSVTTVEHNDTMHFFYSSICVEVDTTKLSIRNFSALEDAAVLDAFLDCLQNDACLKTNVFRNFSDLIFAAAKIISKFYVLENSRRAQVEMSNGSLNGIPEAFYHGIKRDQKLAKLLAKSISYIVCSQIALEVKNYTDKANASVASLCSAATLVWFGVPPRTPTGTDLLCYNIENFTTFSSQNEQYEISFFHQRLQPDDARQLDSNVAYLSVDETPIVVDETSNYVTVPFGGCVYVELELTTRISVVSKRSRPCSAERPYFECYGRCSVLELGRKCGCLSVSWQLYITDGIEPSIANTSCMARYSGALGGFEPCARAAHEQRASCTRSCLRLCEKNMVNFAQSDYCPSELLEGTNKTTVVYALHRQFYMHVVEQLSFDISSVVSDVGGVVGLWLGAGFIGILEAMLFLPKAVAEYVGLCGTKKSKSRSMEVLERLEHLEAEVILLKSNRGKDDMNVDVLSPHGPQPVDPVISESEDPTAVLPS